MRRQLEPESGRLGLQLGQVFSAVISALVLGLLAWAWNITQDVRGMKDRAPDLVARVEKLEAGFALGRGWIEQQGNRLTKGEQIDVNLQQQMTDLRDDLAVGSRSCIAEITQAREAIRYLEAQLRAAFPLSSATPRIPPSDR